MYLYQVELAVQHALALLLPEAQFSIQSGVASFRRSHCILNKTVQFQTALRALPTRREDCVTLAISAPKDHALPFRLMLESLGFRGFRKRYAESPFIVWRLPVEQNSCGGAIKFTD